MKLLYFTNSFPFGIGEQWKYNELIELVKHFDNVTVVPFSYAGNYNPKPMPPGVYLNTPLFEEDSFKFSKKDIFKIIFNTKSGLFFYEFLQKKVWINKVKLKKWILSTLKMILLKRNSNLDKILTEADSETILYFYWGIGSCEVLPLIDTKKFKKIFVRMHRYDLFEYENENYIPYRESLLNSISIAAPSSDAGTKHLNALYPRAKCIIKTVRCGTIGNGKRAMASNGKVFRVVSCSFLSTVKRVNLMIEALLLCDFQIVWHHIGDGVLFEELDNLVRKYKLENKFIFKGNMDSRNILDYYTDNEIDLFVNVSRSEGVPFSIMEAFSVGIPVMATDVGGTGEIVNNEFGRLLPADITPEYLANSLKQFYILSKENKMQIRENAYKCYMENWNAQKLALELAEILKS